MATDPFEDRTGPFGNPDGARSNLPEMLRDFVPFDPSRHGEGISLKEGDLSARVLIGPKGSGKTVYLRRAQATAAANPAVYADDIQQDLPETSSIVKFCQAYRTLEITEKWQTLWHRAILRSLVTHILCRERLAAHVQPEVKARILEYARELHISTREPLSVYSQVTSIITNFGSAVSYDRYLLQDTWSELESAVSDAFRYLPPICFYIDAVDDEYAHAPNYWLQCQKGLYYRVMRLLRDAKLGGRLHVMIAVRDHVYSSVLKSEHATRYRTEPHLRLLNWTHDATAHLLREKIDRLSSSHLMSPDSASPIRRWLGLTVVNNEIRGVQEDLFNYLLRHTRNAPRDIVVLGNALCDEVERAKRSDLTAVSEERLRAVVATVARWFGDEQLAICANHISSDVMPAEAGRLEFSEIYTASAEYHHRVLDALKRGIREVGKDRFSFQDAEAAADLIAEELGSRTDVLSVLWLNGMLGYTQGEREFFFSFEGDDRFTLPAGKSEYVFHPTLVDSLDLEAVGGPVLGKQGV